MDEVEVRAPDPHGEVDGGGVGGIKLVRQWGVVGIFVLYAMWLVHLALFRGDGLVTWIGLLVVVQNILTSLFNSHLFDFVEGWTYIWGVGVVGGLVLEARTRDGLARSPSEIAAGARDDSPGGDKNANGTN